MDCPEAYTVLDGFPGGTTCACLSIRYLRTAEDASATEGDVEDPAHWAVYLTEDCAYFDRETGEPVDDAQSLRFDDDTRDDGDARTRRGVAPLQHGRGTLGVRSGVVLPGLPECRPDTRRCCVAGAVHPPLVALSRTIRRLRPVGRRPSVASGANCWRSTDSVTPLPPTGGNTSPSSGAQDPPKGAATSAAYCLIRDRFIQSQNHGEDLTAELWGVKDFREVRALVADASTNLDPRAQVITLAIVLGALEARCPKDAWRSAKSGITGSAMYNSHTLGSGFVPPLLGRDRLRTSGSGANSARRAHFRRGLRRRVGSVERAVIRQFPCRRLQRITSAGSTGIASKPDARRGRGSGGESLGYTSRGAVSQKCQRQRKLISCRRAVVSIQLPSTQSTFRHLMLMVWALPRDWQGPGGRSFAARSGWSIQRARLLSAMTVGGAPMNVLLVVDSTYVGRECCAMRLGQGPVGEGEALIHGPGCCCRRDKVTHDRVAPKPGSTDGPG